MELLLKVEKNSRSDDLLDLAWNDLLAQNFGEIHDSKKDGGMAVVWRKRLIL